MIKRIISIMTALVFMAGLFTITGFAAGTELSGSCGDNATWFINSDDMLVISGTGSTTRDESLQWKYYCQDVKKVLVEEGITGLSNNDFYYCKNATEIIFPSTISVLGACMSSQNLGNLEDVWIFSKNVQNSKLEGNGAFYPKPGSGVKWHVYEGSTTETSLREGLKLTDDDFEYISDSEKIPEVTNRTPVVVPELTETSGPCGLHSTWSWNELTKTLTFKGSGSIAISSDFQALEGKVEKVEMKDSEITSICDNAFSSVSSVTPSDVTPKCPNIKSVTFPSTLKTIGNNAFAGTALANENLELPEGLETIGYNAFIKTNISGTLKLPASLTYIGQGAFCNTKIENIEFNNTETLKIYGSAFAKTNLKNVTLPNNIEYNVYYDNPPGPNALFSHCTSLETAVVPGDGILLDRFSIPTENTIPEQFFYGCNSLKTVYIQKGLKVIQYHALDNCASLEDIYIFSTDLTTISAVNNEFQSIDVSNNPTFHIIKGSTTETTLREAGYLTDENVIYLADTKGLEEAISRAEEIDITKYTEETASVLTSALENAKAVLENSDVEQTEVDDATEALNNAISGLKEKPQPTEPSSNPTKPEPSKASVNQNKPTTKTPTKTTVAAKTTRSAAVVAKDKAAAEKVMKQAKINKLTVKSKAKKKITVTWKKVKKAVGYEVQISTNKKFKKSKSVLTTTTAKKKLVIKNKKLKSGRKYYVRVRAYATYKDANNTPVKVYSNWNNKLRTVKVK